MKHYFKKGYIIYLDNWYTSPILFQYLLKRNTGACGTIKSNRKGMPVFKKKFNIGECQVAVCNKPKIMTCKWKDKRDVHMISTVHKHKMSSTGKTNRNGHIIKKTCKLVLMGL